MIKRFWHWIIGHQKIDLNININIQDLEDILKVIPRSNNKKVIIDSEEQQSYAKSRQPKQNTTETPKKKRLTEDPLTANEVSSIMLSGGIKKATDKTGKDVVSESEGNSTDQTVSSLKQILGGKKKDV